MAGWYSEHTFFWVELDLKSAQIFKGFLEVFEECLALLRLHHNIIYIDVGISAELL